MCVVEGGRGEEEWWEGGGGRRREEGGGRGGVVGGVKQTLNLDNQNNVVCMYSKLQLYRCVQTKSHRAHSLVIAILMFHMLCNALENLNAIVHTAVCHTIGCNTEM